VQNRRSLAPLSAFDEFFLDRPSLATVPHWERSQISPGDDAARTLNAIKESGARLPVARWTTLDSDEFPYAYVTVRGPVVLTDDPDELLE
jgi:hypothetical protein